MEKPLVRGPGFFSFNQSTWVNTHVDDMSISRAAPVRIPQANACQESATKRQDGPLWKKHPMKGSTNRLDKSSDMVENKQSIMFIGPLPG